MLFREGARRGPGAVVRQVEFLLLDPNDEVLQHRDRPVNLTLRRNLEAEVLMLLELR